MVLSKAQRKKLNAAERRAAAGQAKPSDAALINKLKALSFASTPTPVAGAAGPNTNPINARLHPTQRKRRGGGGTSRNTLSNMLQTAIGPVTSEPGYLAAISNPGEHARTSTGAAAFLTVAHPWSVTSDYAGYPDDATGDVATPHLKTNVNVAYDASMFLTPPTNPSLGTYRFIFPPIPEIAFMWQIYDATSNTWSRIRVVRDQGFRGESPKTPGAGWPAFLTDAGASQHRVPAKGATILFDVSALNNTGTIYAGQLMPELLTKTVNAVATNGDQISGLVEQYVFPDGTEGLTRVDPSSVDFRAPNGVAMPLKISAQGGAFMFKPAYSSEAIIGGADVATSKWVRPTAMRIGFAVGDDDAVFHQFVPADQIKAPTGMVMGQSAYGPNFESISPGGSAASDNFWGVVYFEGVSLVAATGTGATMRVKTVTHPDFRIFTDTTMSMWTHPLPVFDPKAIESILILQQATPSAYYASANSLGSFLKGALGWAASKGKGLIQSLVSMIPVVGPLASQAAGPVLDTADYLVNGTGPLG